MELRDIQQAICPHNVEVSSIWDDGWTIRWCKHCRKIMEVEIPD